MAIERVLASVVVASLVVVACGSGKSSQNVTITPVGSAPRVADVDASVDASTGYGATARAELDAAEALAGAGHLAEARVAFLEMGRRYPYSKLAPEAELRVAELDEKVGNHAQATEELRTWSHNHPSDPRAAAIRARADTVGDVTCHTDADCAIATKQSCCDCCSSGPYATSRTWLAWRDGECARTQCVACAKKCAPFDISTAHAACRANACALGP